MNLKNKTKPIKAITAIILVLFAFGLGYWYYAFANPVSPTVYLDDLPATATYIVKTDATNYWAIRYDGYKVGESTNMTAFFATIEAMLVTGDYVHFQKGVFAMDHGYIFTKAGITWGGSGQGSTIFRLTSTAKKVSNDASATFNLKASNLVFKDFTIDNNGRANTSQTILSGLITGGGYLSAPISNIVIDNIEAYDFWNVGIYVTGSSYWGYITKHVVVQNSYAHKSNHPYPAGGGEGSNGLASFFASDVKFLNNRVTDVQELGIDIYTKSTLILVQGNTVYDLVNSGYEKGIFIENAQNVTVTNNFVYGFDGQLISVTGNSASLNINTTDVIISTNNLYGKPSGSGSAAGTYIFSEYSRWIKRVVVAHNTYVNIAWNATKTGGGDYWCVKTNTALIEGLIIEGNTFFDSWRGVKLTVNGAKVLNNDFSKLGSMPMKIEGENNTVQGNSFGLSTLGNFYSIYNYGDRTRILDNKFNLNYGGIDLETTSKNIEIRGNSFETWGYRAIMFGASIGNIYVENNRFPGYGTVFGGTGGTQIIRWNIGYTTEASGVALNKIDGSTISTGLITNIAWLSVSTNRTGVIVTATYSTTTITLGLMWHNSTVVDATHSPSSVYWEARTWIYP